MNSDNPATTARTESSVATTNAKDTNCGKQTEKPAKTISGRKKTPAGR